MEVAPAVVVVVVGSLAEGVDNHPVAGVVDMDYVMAHHIAVAEVDILPAVEGRDYEKALRMEVAVEVAVEVVGEDSQRRTLAEEADRTVVEEVAEGEEHLVGDSPEEDVGLAVVAAHNPLHPIVSSAHSLRS